MRHDTNYLQPNQEATPKRRDFQWIDQTTQTFCNTSPRTLSLLVLLYALKPSPVSNPDSNSQAINTASVKESETMLIW